VKAIKSNIKLNESPTHGRVLVIEFAGAFECGWGQTNGMVVNRIRLHRPDYLVIDARELRGIRSCLSVFLEVPVAGANEMQRLSPERQTRLLATGEDATALNRFIPMAKLEDLLGRTVFPDLQSALGAENRSQ
jgi:hypothetical protein